VCVNVASVLCRVLPFAPSVVERTFSCSLLRRYARGMDEMGVEAETEKGHFKGSCSMDCRRCALEEELEIAAQMDLIGATAIEDRCCSYVSRGVFLLCFRSAEFLHHCSGQLYDVFHEWSEYFVRLLWNCSQVC